MRQAKQPSQNDEHVSCSASLYIVFSLSMVPSGRAIHAPQISMRIFGEIPGDYPFGDFLMISLRKFRGNEGEITMWIFPPPFPVGSLGIPRVSLKNFEMRFNDIGRISVM